MDDPAKNVRVIFIGSSSGSEPVCEWLQSLPAENRLVVGTNLKTVEFCWPIGMPVFRHLESEIWEVRSRLPDKTIARVLFVLDGNDMVLINGFIRKTQTTPRQEIELARRRCREMQS